VKPSEIRKMTQGAALAAVAIQLAMTVCDVVVDRASTTADMVVLLMTAMLVGASIGAELMSGVSTVSTLKGVAE
jgi:hypothetical protein